jgi:hypothetical protein
MSRLKIEVPFASEAFATHPKRLKAVSTLFKRMVSKWPKIHMQGKPVEPKLQAAAAQITHVRQIKGKAEMSKSFHR